MTELANYLVVNTQLDSSASVDALDSLVDRFASIVRLKRKRAAGIYDVFMCHHSEDKPEVKAVGELLKERGYLPWLDEWELQPGLIWQAELQNQLQAVESAAIFVGSSGIGPWQNVEINAILRQFVERGRPAIPVILPSCKHIPELPLFLSGHTWVDFRMLDPDPLKRLIWGFTGNRHSP